MSVSTLGNDMVPWSNSAQPNGLFLLRWVSKDNNDSVYFGLAIPSATAGSRTSTITSRMRSQPGPTVSTTEFTLGSKRVFHLATRRPLGGTVINGPPKPFFEGIGAGPLIPGISPDVGLVNYTMFMLSPRDYLTVRNDMLDDIKGERTGFINVYTEHTVGWAHYFSPNLIMRPEIRYDRAYNTPAFDNGTRKNQFTFGADVIMRS